MIFLFKFFISLRQKVKAFLRSEESKSDDRHPIHHVKCTAHQKTPIKNHNTSFFKTEAFSFSRTRPCQSMPTSMTYFIHLKNILNFPLAVSFYKKVRSQQSVCFNTQIVLAGKI